MDCGAVLVFVAVVVEVTVLVVVAGVMVFVLGGQNVIVVVELVCTVELVTVGTGLTDFVPSLVLHVVCVETVLAPFANASPCTAYNAIERRISAYLQL